MKFRTNYVEAFLSGDKRSIKNRARLKQVIKWNITRSDGLEGNPRTGVRLIIIVAVITGILLRGRNY